MNDSFAFEDYYDLIKGGARHSQKNRNLLLRNPWREGELIVIWLIDSNLYVGFI